MPTTATPPPDPQDPGQIVASAWTDQALWTAVANRLGQSIRLWRTRAAVASVAGLFLSLLATTLGTNPVAQKVVATLGVLLLALVPVLQQRLLSADRVLAWTRARSVGEQLESAIYRHLMGALPAAPLDDGSPAPDPGGPGNLVRHCRAIKQAAADLAMLAATTPPDARPRKTVMTLDDYLSERLDNQINWYRQKGLTLGRSVQRLQQLEFGLSLLSVLLGALVGNLLPSAATPELLATSPLAPWLALIATSTAAVTSHIAGTRNLEIAAKYFATQDLLRTLRDEWRVDPDRDSPARIRRLVQDAESVMAAEHGGWVSGWARAAQQGAAATVATAAAAPVPARGAEPAPPTDTDPAAPADAEPAGPADTDPGEPADTVPPARPAAG